MVVIDTRAGTPSAKLRISTFPNACGEALLAKREFMARVEGECRNEFR